MPHHNDNTGRAFTLVELLVVITIIVLLAATIIPTAYGVFKAQADIQSYSLLNAQLGAARAQAIMTGGYGAVHIQLSDRDDDTEDQCFMAVLQGEDLSGTMTLVLAPGYQPIATAGAIAFGRFGSPYISGNAFATGAFSDDDAINDFTTMTFVFNSQGESVYLVDGANPVLGNSTDNSLFTSGSTPNESDPELWKNPGTGVPAVTAAVLFDLDTLTTLDTSTKRASYLDENAQFLPINTYTGMLFPPE